MKKDTVSESEKERQTPCDSTYLWNLKYAQNCIPVFVANINNYSEILNFIENQVKT